MLNGLCITDFDIAFDFCLTSLFIWRLLQVRPGVHRSSEEPKWIAGARFLQTGCSSCHLTNSFRAMKEYLI